MIKNFSELNTAFIECLQRMPDGTDVEIMAWADADPEVQHLRRLVDVYQEAKRNPPFGVIGVGIITYAEQKLREAQQ